MTAHSDPDDGRDGRVGPVGTTGRPASSRPAETPEEWGRRQAAMSPSWSEEKWRQVGRIFGVDFVGEKDRRSAEQGGPATDGGITPARSA
jgi:hypothetical protein